MKKLLSLTTALLFCLLIVGCKNRTLYFNYDEMIEKVVKIDIIDIEELGTRRTDGISEKVVGTIDDELIAIDYIEKFKEDYKLFDFESLQNHLENLIGYHYFF